MLVIIPTYNNATTIRQVVESVLQQWPKVLVVNDGSTDDTLQQLQDLPIHLLTIPQNSGKGHALRAGFQEARRLGFHYALTLDGDGQHFASDIPAFIQMHQQHPDALLVGARNLQSENMPAKNTFANRFSNFWFALQTCQRLPDTQTGFRLYPLDSMGQLRLLTSRYEAELEMLVFAAWRGTELISLPVQVYYPKKEERVSHFRPGYDFTRISLLNTVLCVLALFYGYPRMLLSRLNRIV